jgi:hypothetical protein
MCEKKIIRRAQRRVYSFQVVAVRESSSDAMGVFGAQCPSIGYPATATPWSHIWTLHYHAKYGS